MIAASVIVRTYNRPQLLERCLLALRAQDPATPPYEIVIVDDRSGPDTQAVVDRIAGGAGNIIYLRHEVNRGRSAALNTGVQKAGGRIVLFVDDDVMVEPGYVAAHLQVHADAKDQRVAVIGNLRFPPEIVAASNYAKYLQSRYLGQRDAKAWQHLDPSDLHPRFLIGAVASVRREDLFTVGPFNETMRFYGCEDHAFAHGLRRLGARFVFAPDARALHYDSVALSWYRAKLQETARDGVPALLRAAPEFLEDTGYADLLPVDWARDRGARLGRKLLLRALLNPAVVVALEGWASRTDRIGWLYSPVICRALSAGWFLQGLGMTSNGPPLVVYGR
jgi:GT2 family glycosyltransferase